MGKTESKPKPSADRHLSYIINSGQHGVKPEPVQLAEKRWAVQSTNQHPRLIDTSPILWSKVGSTESKPLPLSDRQLVWKHWAVQSTNQHPWLIHTSPIKLGTAQYKPAPAADRHLSYKTRQCTVQTHIRGWCLPKKLGSIPNKYSRIVLVKDVPPAKPGQYRVLGWNWWKTFVGHYFRQH